MHAVLMMLQFLTPVVLYKKALMVKLIRMRMRILRMRRVFFLLLVAPLLLALPLEILPQLLAPQRFLLVILLFLTLLQPWRLLFLTLLQALKILLMEALLHCPGARPGQGQLIFAGPG